MSTARRHLLVTAGPTREHIDPVRYLSNESSGLMGFAIAAEGARAGHQVTLIAGPVCLEAPQGVRRVDVISARDMLAAVEEAFQDADVLFMAAAVADFRPRHRLQGKWKRKEQGPGPLQLTLVENPDVLASVAAEKGDRRVVAFALETDDGERRAMEKLRAKNADWIVLNDPSAQGATRSSVVVLSAAGVVARIEDEPKEVIARALLGIALGG
ncbi:MAG: phosphopantothenoylcysteine decarboxylase [Planctomycetota bacterium]